HPGVEDRAGRHLPLRFFVDLSRYARFGVSPNSILPPGSSHSSRSLRRRSTLPSRTTTPLIETGNACGTCRVGYTPFAFLPGLLPFLLSQEAERRRRVGVPSASRAWAAEARVMWRCHPL